MEHAILACLEDFRLNHCEYIFFAESGADLSTHVKRDGFHVDQVHVVKPPVYQILFISSLFRPRSHLRTDDLAYQAMNLSQQEGQLSKVVVVLCTRGLDAWKQGLPVYRSQRKSR